MLGGRRADRARKPCELRLDDGQSLDGMHGKRLSELSASGRLQTIQQFIIDNASELRPIQEGDMSSHTSVDIYMPTWQENSYPANPEDMRFLPVGTKVKIELPEKTVIHQITRSWAVNGGESTTYEINLDIRQPHRIIF